MKSYLIDTLETVGFPVYLQGTLNPEEAYPESFITFQVFASTDNAFYDNEDNATDWYINVNFYSSNPALVETIPKLIRTALKNAGFIPQGRGQDLPSDRQTHTGWAMEFIFKKFITKEF